jgi:hypothetical protein
MVIYDGGSTYSTSTRSNRHTCMFVRQLQQVVVLEKKKVYGRVDGHEASCMLELARSC